MENIYKRLARLEAMMGLQKSEMDENILSAYEIACQNKDEEEAAFLLRKFRNKQLDATDKYVTVDRLKEKEAKMRSLVPSTEEMLRNNPWVIYRQELRDLPQQVGFPFEITMPVSPEQEEEKERNSYGV